MKKLSILAIGAAGYVLGTRAGRERYEQIRKQADKVWSSPTVQSTVDDVQTQAKHAASDVGSRVSNTVTETFHDVTKKVRGEPTTPSASPMGDAPIASDFLPPVPGSPAVVAEPPVGDDR